MVKDLVTNPNVVLRKEFDDWAVLFDPDTGDAVGTNPIGVTVWNALDECDTLEDLATVVRASFEDVPDTVQDDIEAFVADLLAKGLVGKVVEERP